MTDRELIELAAKAAGILAFLVGWAIVTVCFVWSMLTIAIG